MKIIIDPEYPDHDAAEVDEEINGDLIDTRGKDDEPCT